MGISLKRLPAELQPTPVQKETKEARCIDAEDVVVLSQWYAYLEKVTRNLRPGQLYNFGECGFQSSQGIHQMVISGTPCRLYLPKAEHSRTITVLECIWADGWSMSPFYISQGTHSSSEEDWFYESDSLPPQTLIRATTDGCINDQLALIWLDHFHATTKDRVKKREKRVLLFDGHRSPTTFKFLEKCENYNILPFGFVPHSTQLCQPLDGKPFLAIKNFWEENNDIAYRSGQPATQSELLQMIAKAREVCNPRMIRDSFKERGIYPTDGKDIVEELWSQLQENSLPDLSESHTNREPTPSQELHSSSSVEEEPPKTLAQIKRNQQKCLIASDTAKQRRNLERVFKHQQILHEQVAINRDIIASLCAEQPSRQRKYTIG